MLRDGKYAAWFRTPRGQGTGLVELIEGRISGRDSFFTYGGSYQVGQQRFTAVLTVKRHAEGNPSVFGPDEVEVNLTGLCSGAMATCSGTAREAPEVRFECTLIYSQEEALPADVKAPSSSSIPTNCPRGSTAGRGPGRHLRRGSWVRVNQS